jgi:hypothetical protein
MSVSKHNLWKRKKNGVMKLVRSHRDWLEKRRHSKNKLVSDGTNTTTATAHVHKTDSKLETTKGVSSAKRTQIGKKV